MAITQSGISATALSSGSKHGTTLFTSTGNNAITTVIVCNSHASDTINLSLYVVPSGMNPYDSGECIIVKSLPIPAGETVSFDQEKIILADGDKLEGVASVAWTGVPAYGLAVTVSTLPV